METFPALQADKQPDGKFAVSLVQRRVEDLPPGEVLIRVACSSLNYKDALSASGNPGVTRSYPHTPGIDAAGVVVHSDAPGFAAGDEVIVTGYDLGMNTSGGFAGFIRVPAAWVLKRPAGLGLREAMLLGTAGLTAALCVDKLLRNGLQPGAGPVLVTGASGGVGSIAVALLAHLGCEVVAASGKTGKTGGAADFLRQMGARDVIGREELLQDAKRALLKPRWAGAVDTVGGSILFAVVKSLQPGASVACCGLTAGVEFAASVFPFILRGVNLLGVDSVEIPLSAKAAMWEKWAGAWKLPGLDALAREVALEQVPAEIERMLKGQQTGRVLVTI